jgi:outer membrane protein assembly factor BamB
MEPAIFQRGMEPLTDRLTMIRKNVKSNVLTRSIVVVALTILTCGLGIQNQVFSQEAQVQQKDGAKENETDKNWPRFRGPHGLGISVYTDTPTSWNGKTGEGVLWKTAVPLPGENSPIIWGDRVFLTGADREKREVYCFDANTGDLLWQKSTDNISSESDYRKVSDSSVLTASTSATDGERIFSIFANGDIFCLDFGGNIIWSKCIGPIVNDLGHASSLLVHQDLLLIQLDHGFENDDLSKIVALKTHNGDVAWSTTRKTPVSWSTPIIIDAGERKELITCANPWVIAYDPVTGKEWWRVNCLAGEVALSPVYSDGLVFIANAMAVCAALRPGGQGDVTNTHVVWAIGDIMVDICSPLATGKFLFLLESGGYLFCYDAQTGKTVWEHDLENGFTASPSLVGDRIYFLAEDGVMTIIKNDQEYKEIAKCELGDKTQASPAFINGKIYIRGEKNLYCIGKKRS